MNKTQVGNCSHLQFHIANLVPQGIQLGHKNLYQSFRQLKSFSLMRVLVLRYLNYTAFLQGTTV